jgi:hypothetical protein
MLKLLTFPGTDEDGNIFVQVIEPNSGLTKVASHGKLAPEISSVISGLTADSENVYILVNALGAGEYYGSNINGDFFEESELSPKVDTELAGYKTFSNAGIYRHHKNKDIEKSMGKVITAAYNPVMHRVELIIRINRRKAESEGHGDLVRRLDSGEHPAVSMGCKVKYDVCSICGHKSKTRADYCVHAKTMMGKVFPDGRKVFVYNPRPRFFDLSFVVIGADRTSYAMAKVASAYGMSSALLAESEGIRDGDTISRLKEKLAKKQKVSKILKRVPAMSAKVLGPLNEAEPNLGCSTLNRLGSHPLNRVLTTSAAGGIVLKPREYQRIILIRIGRPGLADRLDHAGQIFPQSQAVDKSVSFGRPNEYSTSIRNLLMNIIPQRSMFEPVLRRRITIIRPAGGSTNPEAQRMLVLRKLGSSVDINLSDDEKGLLNKIAASYNGYRIQLMENMNSIVDDITRGDIKLLSTIDDGARLEDAFMGQDITKEAKLPFALLGVLPMAYLYGAHARKKRGRGEPLGALDKFVERHPVLATSVFVGLTRLGAKMYGAGMFGKGMEKLLAKID